MFSHHMTELALVLFNVDQFSSDIWASLARDEKNMCHADDAK